MAYLIQTPSGGGLVGAFEPLVLKTLLDQLPASYGVAPNFQLKQKTHDALEYDFIVLAPHAIYVIEAKEWYGRLTGDDSEWLIGHSQSPRKCPMWLVNTKCKVLKTELGPVGNQAYVAACLVVPDGTMNLLGGNWAHHVNTLTELIAYLQDLSKITKSTDLKSYHKGIIAALQGKWGARQHGKRRRIGSYEITETLSSDDKTGEFLAKRALIENDPARYRIRTFRLDPALPADAQAKQKAFIRRPTEAVSKIGPHPNLLRVLQFDFVPDDNEFFEVTEWSEFGTLHGFFNNKDRDRLTLRERLEIAEGVASALSAVHAHEVIHRNVCPKTILIGFDRRPRLTDFDRAFIDSEHTVFAATASKQDNPAYVAPELEDVTDYDYDTTSDMYSFGVLLYQLLADRPPFKDAKEAKARQGVPEKMPSELREGVDPRLDKLVVDLLRVDDFHARPSADDALAVLHDTLEMTTGTPKNAAQTAPAVPSPPSQRFEVGALIDGTWRIDERLGSGAMTRVFKVFNLDHQRTYTMKVLHDDENADVVLDEFRTLKNLLPAHPNLAKLEWMARFAPPESTPYVLYEYIEGETLEAYCRGEKRLAWGDIKNLGLKLLDGLAALHKAGVVHRDLKPANILLELPLHEPKLIDFNIAKRLDAPRNPGGTPRYWAPDRMTAPLVTCDLFSLGIVLYELVVHNHPFVKDRPEEGEPHNPKDIAMFPVSDELAAFLHKCVQPSAVKRFQSAQTMSEALSSIESMFAPAAPPSVLPGQFPGITVSPQEASKKNYNPYVTRLLTLYSQARRSNSGTRGLDEIARLTYVQTKLDQKLAPSVVSGNFRLVIVTGNAGDGKTAFLQKVEGLFEQMGADISRLDSDNGSRWSHQNLTYETNYDGSQDEGDRENDAVLAQFFTPFAGEPMAGTVGGEVRLIAINEGRLLDFLTHSEFASKFSGLRSFVLKALHGQSSQPGVLLVNLNLRSVAAGGRDSLVERQLAAMLSDTLWAPCESCAHRNRCPIKHNVESLRDPSSGPAVRERVRRLFEVQHLRRRAHVTMRDLRSSLSFMLLRDHSCEDVAELVDAEPEELARLYYPNAFADLDAEEGQPIQSAFGREQEGHEERAIDRLVRRLREVDVGLVNAPLLDRRLSHEPETAVPWMTFEQRSRTAWEVMLEMTRNAPLPGDDYSVSELLQRRRRLISMWRRWAFFERRDDGWRSMLPYRSTHLLERIIHSEQGVDRAEATEQLRDNVVDAVCLSEGVRSPAIRKQFLALKITRVREAPVRSYRLFPKIGFDVRVPRATGLTDYLEHAPDSIELAESGTGFAKLRISLDLLEMLELIRNGYRPTASELQGLFVNLLIFRNELLTTTFNRVLLTTDDQEFYEVAAEGTSEGIVLSLEKQKVLGLEQNEGVSS